MSKNTGGPAFPEVDYKQPVGGGSHVMTIHGGMTLRDYFAVKAMQSLIAIPCREWPDAPQCQEDASVSKAAYKMADCMLAARDQ